MSANDSSRRNCSADKLDFRYRIGVLLYFRSLDGEVLLIRRSKKPNVGLWCAVGGKLEMAIGESPIECAIREAREEVGLHLNEESVSLRAILSERNYEATGHWLMFVFEILYELKRLPEPIEEGVFGFFRQEELDDLNMPPLDKRILIDRILNEKAAALHVLHAIEGTEKEPELLEEEETIG